MNSRHVRALITTQSIKKNSPDFDLFSGTRATNDSSFHIKLSISEQPESMNTNVSTDKKWG